MPNRPSFPLPDATPGSTGGLTRDREIAAPAFPGDTGEPDDHLAAALAALREGRGSSHQVMAAIARSRLIVPVVALLGEIAVDDDGRVAEKSADMATTLLTGADGRRALLAFTSLSALQAWRPGARPVPVSAADAARAALQEEADAIVLDLAGPTPFPIEGEDLVAIASGWELVQVAGGSAWIRPAIG